MGHTVLMLALAIVLLVLVLLLVIVSFVGNSEELVIEFLNVTITASVGGVFVAGVVCGLIALASALALRRSWRRQQARTNEVRELRRLAGVPDKSDHADSADTTAGSAGRATSDPARPATSDSAGQVARSVSVSSDTSNDTAPIPGPKDSPRT